MTHIKTHGARGERQRAAGGAHHVLLFLAAAVLAACSDKSLPVAVDPVPDQVNVLLVAQPYTHVRAGFYTSCAVTSDARAACWGYLATPAPALAGVTRVSPSNGGACAVTSGSVTCFGPTTTDEPPVLNDAVDVTVGLEHACALRSNGQVACWGNNRYGQFSGTALLSDVVEISAGQYSTCVRFQNNGVSCIATLFGQTSVPASLEAVQISAGTYNVCAVTTGANVVCWGNQPQINSVPTNLGSVAEVRVGLLFACARLTSGEVRCWGNNTNSATTVPAGTVVSQLSSGFYHTCGIRPAGSLACWGYDFQKQSTPPAMPSVRVLPTATFEFPASVLAGNTITLSLNDAQVDGGPTGLVFSYAFDCGDGSGFSAPGASHTATCSTTDGGTRIVQGRVIDSANDASTYTGTVDVSLTAQAITFTSTPPDPAFAGTGYAPSATGGASGNPVTFSSVTPSTCSTNGPTVSLLASGDCTVAANQAASAGYAAAPQVTQSFSIVQQSQSITFDPLPASSAVGTVLTLNAIGGASGNPVVFSSTTPGTCSVTGIELTLTAAGGCTVAANQAGNAAYSAAPEMTRSTTGVRLPQSITVTSALPATAPVGTILALSATGGASGNPVLVAAQTPAVCSVSGNSLALNAAGLCTVVFTQAGNTMYDDAVPVTRSVTAMIVRVETTLTALRADVAGSTIDAALRSALLGKLDAAQLALDANDRRTACGSLGAFANQVIAKRGKGISRAVADAWLTQVAQVQRDTGC